MPIDFSQPAQEIYNILNIVKYITEGDIQALATLFDPRRKSYAGIASLFEDRAQKLQDFFTEDQAITAYKQAIIESLQQQPAPMEETPLQDIARQYFNFLLNPAIINCCHNRDADTTHLFQESDDFWVKLLVIALVEEQAPELRITKLCDITNRNKYLESDYDGDNTKKTKAEVILTYANDQHVAKRILAFFRHLRHLFATDNPDKQSEAKGYMSKNTSGFMTTEEPSASRKRTAKPATTPQTSEEPASKKSHKKPAGPPKAAAPSSTLAEPVVDPTPAIQTAMLVDDNASSGQQDSAALEQTSADQAPVTPAATTEIPPTREIPMPDDVQRFLEQLDMTRAIFLKRAQKHESLKITTADLQETADGLKKALAETMKKLETSETALKTSQDEAQAIQAKVTQLTTELAAAQATLQDNTAQLASSTTALQQKEEALKQATDELQKIQKTSEKMKTDAATLQKTHRDTQTKLANQAETLNTRTIERDQARHDLGIVTTELAKAKQHIKDAEQAEANRQREKIEEAKRVRKAMQAAGLTPGSTNQQPATAVAFAMPAAPASMLDFTEMTNAMTPGPHGEPPVRFAAPTSVAEPAIGDSGLSLSSSFFGATSSGTQYTKAQWPVNLSAATTGSRSDFSAIETAPTQRSQHPVADFFRQPQFQVNRTTPSAAVLPTLELSNDPTNHVSSTPGYPGNQ